MAWKTFYFCGDGLFPDISMLVESIDDWDKIVKVYNGDLVKLRKMLPEVNHKGYGGPGEIGDDVFYGLPNLGELLDSMEED